MRNNKDGINHVKTLPDSQIDESGWSMNQTLASIVFAAHMRYI